MFEIQGTVKVLTDTKMVGKDGSLKVRLLLLHVSGKYPKDIAFEIMADRCDNVQAEVGQAVSIAFDLRSNQSDKDPDRWFTTAKLIQIQVLAATPIAPAPAGDDESEEDGEVPF